LSLPSAKTLKPNAKRKERGQIEKEASSMDTNTKTEIEEWLSMMGDSLQSNTPLFIKYDKFAIVNNVAFDIFIKSWYNQEQAKEI